MFLVRRDFGTGPQYSFAGVRAVAMRTAAGEAARNPMIFVVGPGVVRHLIISAHSQYICNRGG